MEQKSLTALISAFSRAYHALNNEVTIFNDSLARDLLTDEEFNQIAKNMSNGIGFFNPSFVGEPEQALRWLLIINYLPRHLAGRLLPKNLLSGLFAREQNSI